jgi:ubiquinone/menaquinone biosynthesis C-methylase UbiE
MTHMLTDANIQTFLEMQKKFYEKSAHEWSITNRNPVVGSYDAHNNWLDYDIYLFKDFDTQGLIALEYGCGPGRNLIRFYHRFARIDGVDIAKTNLAKARENFFAHKLEPGMLMVCDGKSIPVEDQTYDVVFSTICLQHITCYDVRFAILKEAYRVLKKGGYFCFQMGYGKKSNIPYYSNHYDVPSTNGSYDVNLDSEENIKDDLLNKIGFMDYKSDLRPTGPGDTYPKWIWIQVRK